jgi:hypothetical protein
MTNNEASQKHEKIDKLIRIIGEETGQILRGLKVGFVESVMGNVDTK